MIRTSIPATGRPTHTPLPLSVAWRVSRQNLVAADRCDRQRFGRAIGRIDLSRPVEQRSQLFEDPRRDGRARRDDPLQGRQPHGDALASPARAAAAGQASRTCWSRRNPRSPRRSSPDWPGPDESDPCRARSPSCPGAARTGRRAGMCRDRFRPARSRRASGTIPPEPERSRGCTRPPWAGRCCRW